MSITVVMSKAGRRGQALLMTPAPTIAAPSPLVSPELEKPVFLLEETNRSLLNPCLLENAQASPPPDPTQCSPRPSAW